MVQRHTPWAEENSELGEIEVFEVGEQDAPREKFSSGPLHPKKTSFERERKPQSSPFTSSSSSSSSSSPSCVSLHSGFVFASAYGLRTQFAVCGAKASHRGLRKIRNLGKSRFSK